MTTLDELLMEIQSPVAELILRFSMTVPFWPLRMMGPEENCASKYEGKVDVSQIAASNKNNRHVQNGWCGTVGDLWSGGLK